MLTLVLARFNCEWVYSRSSIATRGLWWLLRLIYKSPSSSSFLIKSFNLLGENSCRSSGNNLNFPSIWVQSLQDTYINTCFAVSLSYVAELLGAGPILFKWCPNLQWSQSSFRCDLLSFSSLVVFCGIQKLGDLGFFSSNQDIIEFLAELLEVSCTGFGPINRVFAPCFARVPSC